MKYNAALCFITYGIALVLRSLDRPGLMLLLVTAGFVFMGMTLVEDVTGRNLGIDALFFRSYDLGPHYPDRVSPITAACFTVSGVALLLTGMPAFSKLRITLIGMIACCASIIALVAMFGCTFGIESMSGLGSYTRMSPYTALTMIILESGLLAWAARMAHAEQFNFARWIPVAASMTLMVMIALLSGVSFYQLKKAERWGRHTYVVLESAEMLMGDFFDLQRGARAFVLTGRTTSLPIYESGLARSTRDLAQLSTLTRDNASQQRNIELLNSQFKDVTLYLQQLLETRRQSFTEAIQLESSGTGFDKLNAMLATLHSITDEEHRLLTERSSSEDADLNNTTRLLISGSILAAALLLTANFIASSEMQLRKKSEATLRLSELGFRRLFEAAQEGILIADAKSLRISDVNPFFVHLLRYAREELIGRTVFDLPTYGQSKLLGTAFAKLKHDGFVHCEDLPLVSKDGRIIAVELVSHIYAVGEQNVVQCTFRDITDRKNAQDEIQRLNQSLEKRVTERTAELEEANKELQAFSYSVSHDLRAPLRHVLGFVQMLKKSLGADLPKSDLGHLAMISEAAARMGELIDDLLAFSRVGQAALEKREVNLNELVQETLKEFQQETSHRKITWDIHPLTPVWADRALLRMVLTNLISNAVKFTKARPEAKIAIGSEPTESGETITFVRDNGAGYNPKYYEKLFGVFQRLHSQTEFEGTGIGLANVQRIVKRHGGRAWAEGAVNQGATFYFSIPKRSEANEYITG